MPELVERPCTQCNGTGFFEVVDPTNSGNHTWIECSAGPQRPYCNKGTISYIELTEADASGQTSIVVTQRFADYIGGTQRL
jgi:hypothetical protein